MYSHGLEQIYAFENINPKSVKTYGTKEQKEPPKEVACARVEELPLPLGPYFEEALPSFRLKEPLSALNLSPFLQKSLLSKNLKTVADACKFLKTQDYKTQGLSHQDELANKIEAFVGKTPFALQAKIDWESLVKGCCKEQSQAFFARYNLQFLANSHSNEPQNQAPNFDDALEAITQAYIRPWLRPRYGMSSLQEIESHLQALSLRKEHFSIIWQLIKDHSRPIKLASIDDKIYFQDNESMEAYMKVVKTLTSYFYHDHAFYPQKLLVHEASKTLTHWGYHYDEGLIEKVLQIAPDFVYNNISSSYTLWTL